jgi:TP901 family phage tail tape measure protein
MTTEAELVITAKERTKPAFNQIKRNLQMVEKQSDRTSSSIASIMNPLKAYVGFAGVRRLVTDFGSFDEALIKVGKTTNISGNDLTNLGEQIKNLDIPVATNDLLKYAEAAGQLGVSGSDNLVKFVDTMARLEKSSDIVGEEGAKSIARILNVSGEGIDTVDNFGSVIVALGNNFAASEREILSHTTEVSRAISVHKVAAAESAALGVSMASLGIRAEGGGSVVGRTFNTINKAIQGGGESLQQLIAITGMTEAQLKSTFKDNAPAVFQSFLSGLNSIDKSGGDMIATLEGIGLKGEEVNKTLPVMAKNSALLARAMSQAKKEVADATALIKESNTAFSTMNADLDKTKKKLTNVTI